MNRLHISCFNSNLPYPGAVIYEENPKDFEDNLNDCQHYQGYSESLAAF